MQTIYLDRNSFFRLLADAFLPLESINTTDIRFYLHTDKIFAIEVGAFSGIGQAVTYLDVHDNQLTSIPASFGELTNLHFLNIKQNPLTTLEAPALPSLSRSLTSLYISMDFFTEWPSEFHYFRRLADLQFDGYQLPRLPVDALSGSLKATLETLHISMSKLDRIPSAVCHLNVLKTFRYISNPNTTSPVFEPCDHAMSSVRKLYLYNNSLHTFPDVLKTFTTISELDASRNFIRTIDAGLIQNGHPLTSINLYDNEFRRIPSALRRFQGLQAISIQNNEITSIGDFDLFNLTRLNYLYMDYNPLEYVSDDAFRSQTYFRRLGLSHTNLHDIPRAVTSVPHIKDLNLAGSPIVCSCDMSYISNVTIDRISGSCTGSEEAIIYFVRSVLPLCS